MKIASSEEMPSMREFFPRIKNDLTKLTWAKHVNNAVAIQDALEEEKVSESGVHWSPRMLNNGCSGVRK
uniref:(California timema) hypothetical protein n=1 Tax=Timema californicum TaxID=61474 RepID=A0A7R9JDN3_TIMCA|nr:unnamed protein product [Timema californicum]